MLNRLLVSTILSLALCGASCSLVKEVAKNPAARSTFYAKEEILFSAVEEAIRSQGYDIEDSNTARILARSANEFNPEKGYRGYALTVSLDQNRYGGRRIGFLRERIIETGKGPRQTREATPAPDQKLYQQLIKEIRKGVRY